MCSAAETASRSVLGLGRFATSSRAANSSISSQRASIRRRGQWKYRAITFTALRSNSVPIRRLSSLIVIGATSPRTSTRPVEGGTPPIRMRTMVPMALPSVPAIPIPSPRRTSKLSSWSAAASSPR